jgi:hypothetical protein
MRSLSYWKIMCSSNFFCYCNISFNHYHFYRRTHKKVTRLQYFVSVHLALLCYRFFVRDCIFLVHSYLCSYCLYIIPFMNTKIAVKTSMFSVQPTFFYVSTAVDIPSSLIWSAVRSAHFFKVKRPVCGFLQKLI